MKARLNKFLAESGIASRRKSEEFITEGRVSVNNKTVKELSFVVDDENDIVKVDGEKVKPQKKVYFILNKPKGYVTTTEDEKGRKIVTDLIGCNQKIFPVGRLDYDTTGVLLLTNDGDFTNFITHPKNHVPREYSVKLNRDLEEEDKLKLLKGIILDRRKSRFQSIVFTQKKYKDVVRVVVIEGRNHFVKRMFGALGYFVDKLDRESFGGITAKGLPVGAYKKMAYAEVEKIYKEYGK
jgi:23S rRNA pseudouridine2605 synthase